MSSVSGAAERGAQTREGNIVRPRGFKRIERSSSDKVARIGDLSLNTYKGLGRSSQPYGRVVRNTRKLMHTQKISRCNRSTE